jgi:hypothetical protein
MNHDQFSLPFLDTTSLGGGGFGLYGGSSTPKPTPARETAGLFEMPAPDPTASLPTQNRTPAIAAHDYRLAGDRRLAEGWKARAEDNLAAIRLMTTIEAEGRHARPDEQERLARFTAFGATDLADRTRSPWAILPTKATSATFGVTKPLAEISPSHCFLGRVYLAPSAISRSRLMARSHRQGRTDDQPTTPCRDCMTPRRSRPMKVRRV